MGNRKSRKLRGGLLEGAPAEFIYFYKQYEDTRWNIPLWRHISTRPDDTVTYTKPNRFRWGTKTKTVNSPEKMSKNPVPNAKNIVDSYNAFLPETWKLFEEDRTRIEAIEKKPYTPDGTITTDPVTGEQSVVIGGKKSKRKTLKKRKTNKRR